MIPTHASLSVPQISSTLERERLPLPVSCAQATPTLAGRVYNLQRALNDGRITVADARRILGDW